MRLFSLPGCETLAAELLRSPRLEAGACRWARFPNRELHVSLESDPAGDPCLLLGATAPPETNLARLTLLAHTLKRAGAGRVTALLPYLGYSRQDKAAAGESLGMAWVGGLLRAAGVDAVATVDAHSARDGELLGCALTSLSPATLFAAALRARGLDTATLAAPDEGAIARCEAVRACLGGSAPIVSFIKHRTARGVTLGEPSGQAGRRVVLVDDILDTGATLVLAARALARQGARDIHIMVTHGGFSGRRWRELLLPPVRSITTTDTLPPRTGLDKTVKRLAVAPLLRAFVEAGDAVRRG
jgi:ribose-phosphate pyrophosphokinase